MKYTLNARKSFSGLKVSVISKTLSHIQKRDGRVVPFDALKIYTAIFKAFIAVREKDGPVVKQVSRKAIANLKSLFIRRIPNVEEIQDVIISTLKDGGFDDVANAYEQYRKKRQEIREAKYFLLYHDVKTVVTENAMKVLESRYLRKD